MSSGNVGGSTYEVKEDGENVKITEFRIGHSHEREPVGAVRVRKEILEKTGTSPERFYKDLIKATF